MTEESKPVGEEEIRKNPDVDPSEGETPETDCPLLRDFAVRGKILRRQYIQRRNHLRALQLAAVADEIVERAGEVKHRLGLLVAVNYDQQRTLNRTPQQHQVQRLCGSRQAG